jgi:hypothetical protein
VILRQKLAFENNRNELFFYDTSLIIVLIKIISMVIYLGVRNCGKKLRKEKYHRILTHRCSGILKLFGFL